MTTTCCVQTPFTTAIKLRVTHITTATSHNSAQNSSKY